MSCTNYVAAIAAAGLISMSALVAMPAQAADATRNLPVTDLAYFETGIGPLQAAQGFGDLNSSAHGTFVKMPAGFVSPLHTHTADYYAVVVSGVMSNESSARKPVHALPPGSYWFQKGNSKHVTKCLSANECVFFITQQAPFDFIPARATDAEEKTEEQASKHEEHKK